MKLEASSDYKTILWPFKKFRAVVPAIIQRMIWKNLEVCTLISVVNQCKSLKTIVLASQEDTGAYSSCPISSNSQCVRTKGYRAKHGVYYSRPGDYSPDGCQLNTKTWPAFRARSVSNNFAEAFFPCPRAPRTVNYVDDVYYNGDVPFIAHH